MTPLLSVILPAHSPHPGRLARTLAGLASQDLPLPSWELLLIDNASPSPIAVLPDLAAALPLRLISEPELGLTPARRRGFGEARAPLCLLVDDDNVLAPAYLSSALRLLAEHPGVVAAGGPSRPEFESPPPVWTTEFHALLALRDLGPKALLATLGRDPATGRNIYPEAAPIGAGLVIRTAAARAWAAEPSPLSDRRGAALTSAGDNDILLHALLHNSGAACAYFPELALTHLIPASRLDPAYLARLNRGIQTSWMQVLTLHNANPWPPLSPASARLRQLKAWFTHRAWSSPAAHVRWSGACGHFAGRIAG